MSRRTLNDENIRNIQKSKRSYYVTLPIEYVRKLGWRVQEKVLIRKMKENLVIEKFKD